jgi:anti-sigma regulatory factor (Ser/Thr protein kinase)
LSIIILIENIAFQTPWAKSCLIKGFTAGVSGREWSIRPRGCMVNTRFTVHSENPVHARQAMRASLLDVEPELVERAELLISELVTNAVVHGAGDPLVVIDVHSDCVHVEVHDADPTPSLTPLHVDAYSEHGRGLAIVDALASSWGVASQDAGKAVWFDIDF